MQAKHVRTAASKAAANTGSSSLHVVVPGDFAGRLIGKKGTNVQELQSRSGARVQLSDLGLEEKIIEVTGPCRCVDTACSLLVVDLAHIQKLQVAGCKLGVRSAEVEVSALIPEELSQWAEEDLLAQHFDAGVEPEVSEEARDVAEISTAAAEAARARPSKRSRDVPELLMDLLGFAEVSGTRFRRLHLVGRPGNVSAALRAVRQRLRRFGRWKAANITELPAVKLEEEVPELKNFVSTENVFLRLDAGLAARLSGPAAEVLAQIKEDSGAAALVHGEHDEAAGASCLEIAGTCSSKLRALVEICHLLLHLPQESPQVELWLRGEGPCAFTLEEALALAESTARAGPRRPKRVVVQLSGSAAAVGASAVALWRESERKAWLHERKHGPPALLVDYFSRWFGGDAGQMLRERQAERQKRGQYDLADRDQDAKRPKTADVLLAVQGPMTAPPAVTATEGGPPKAAKEVESSEDEEVSLPPATALPLFVTEELGVQADTPPAASPEGEVLEAPAPEYADGHHDLASDSDSDYYRPGPAEDPLWARRQAILSKLAGMG
ncbi:unnamed protein product [Durusdinium trenchii]|uniref:K Homology domain-containing protein n=1 Tax=Durusdinium trenchii TaxID=1381693 RepID=A0ABP0T2N0_9DINO